MIDPTGIDCPRAKTFMTPCIARDGHLALTDPPEEVCVGCGIQAGPALGELMPKLSEQDKELTVAEVRMFTGTVTHAELADVLRSAVARYVEGGGST